jgi:hypothetical protein
MRFRGRDGIAGPARVGRFCGLAQARGKGRHATAAQGCRADVWNDLQRAIRLYAPVQVNEGMNERV